MTRHVCFDYSFWNRHVTKSVVVYPIYQKRVLYVNLCMCNGIMIQKSLSACILQPSKYILYLGDLCDSQLDSC
jgi:hypothetical protein